MEKYKPIALIICAALFILNMWMINRSQNKRFEEKYGKKDKENES